MVRIDDGEQRQALTLPRACEWIGQRTGKTPATSTAWRWALRGVRGGIKLESFRIGGTTFTTPEMIRRFIERTSAAAASQSLPLAGPAAASTDDHDARRREIAAAQQRLRQLCQPKRRRKGDSTTVPGEIRS